MKRRILSLIMAVCMVAALLPAMLLSVAAVDNVGFTSTFEYGGENWPNYDPNTEAAVPNFTAFRGNWSAGIMFSGVYAESHYVDNVDRILSNTSVHWNNAEGEPGVYLTSGRVFLTNIRAPYFGTAPEREEDPESETGWSETGETVQGTNKAYAATYTAPYEGKIDLSFVEAAPVLDWDTGSIVGDEVQYFYLAVMVNDTMVWPTAGGSITNPADMARIEALTSLENYNGDLLKNIDVKYGDNVYFVCGRGNTTWAQMVPSVTYQDGYESVPTSMKQTFGASSPSWPNVRGLAGISELVQTDAQWSLGTFDVNSKSFTAHGFQRRLLTDVWTGAGRENDDINLNNKSGIMLKSSAQLSGAFSMGRNDIAAGVYPAYQVTAIASGKGEIRLNPNSLFLATANQKAAKNAMATVEVYKNGNLEKTFTIMTDGNGVASTRDSMRNLTLTKGDVYTFVAKADFTNVKYVTATPVITYNSISSFMSGAATEKYELALEDAAVVVDDTIGLQFKAYGTIDTYRDAAGANVYVWDASVANKTLENATAVIPMTVEQDFAYNAIYTGFAPKQMVDEITAQIVVLKEDGTTLVTSDPATFTVAQKAQETFDNSVDEAEKELMAAVLNYGTYAQLYFGYKTDDLANKDLEAPYNAVNPEEEIYYAQLTDEATGSYFSNTELDAFSLYLDNSLSLRVHLDLDMYEATELKMYVQHGTTEDEYLTDYVGLAVDVNKASVLLENISLKELSQVHYFRVAVQDPPVRYFGLTITYSIESFAARMIDSEEEYLPELVCALMELGRLAAAAN